MPLIVRLTASHAVQMRNSRRRQPCSQMMPTGSADGIIQNFALPTFHILSTLKNRNPMPCAPTAPFQKPGRKISVSLTRESSLDHSSPPIPTVSSPCLARKTQHAAAHALRSTACQIVRICKSLIARHLGQIEVKQLSGDEHPDHGLAGKRQYKGIVKG